jgi:magnesium transporter
MITIFAQRNGVTEQAAKFDRAWLNPASGVYVWVDLAAPSIPEGLILSDTFNFHRLSVEDALSARQYPKVEAYDGYLYVILHGIHFLKGDKRFSTHDIDFFVGPNYLVTIHDGDSGTIQELRDHATRNPKILSEGPVSLLHRIVDGMVDSYRPEIDKLEDRIDDLEKQQIAGLRRIITPQRDVVNRLARRDFVDVSTEMSFRFRDVYDHLVRLADDVMIFQDRITGMLDAHLSNTSNRLNEVMKVLTVVSTILMPMTVLTSVYGMNVPLPPFPGGEHAQFWWLFAIMVVIAVAMLAMFRRRRWI